MDVLRIAAFSDNGAGGNPAGVLLADTLPEADTMQRIAAEVGYSETAFAAKNNETGKWRVRYFSPESEVPFCGHATIALGAVLAQEHGVATYQLVLNDAEISVEGDVTENGFTAALQSPLTRSAPIDETTVRHLLDLFGYSADQLDPRIPPAMIHGGANHMVLALKNRADLAAMNYDLDAGRILMREFDLITVMLVWVENDRQFHSRNAFASGGVLEDPATGAASAAFAGYLRDIGWDHGGRIEIVQGEDMGSKSAITAEFSNTPGSSIKVSGAARTII